MTEQQEKFLAEMVIVMDERVTVLHQEIAAILEANIMSQPPHERDLRIISKNEQLEAMAELSARLREDLRREFGLPPR